MYWKHFKNLLYQNSVLHLGQIKLYSYTKSLNKNIKGKNSPTLLKYLWRQTVLKDLNFFNWNIYFKRAKFTLDFKTKKCLYICFEIKGKFRSFKIYISFKKVKIFQNSLPSKLFLTVQVTTQHHMLEIIFFVYPTWYEILLFSRTN